MASKLFLQHDLDLRPGEAALFERCDPAMRRAIRKAEKANLRIELSTTLESVETYYELHQLTRQKHGVPPQSRRFFRRLWAHVIQAGHGTVFIAWMDQRPAAGAIFLHFGKHSIYKFGASDPACQESRPNNLLLWRGVMEMKRQGAESLSFGRTSQDQDGLARFKRSFGAVESELRYAKYSYATSSFLEAAAESSGGAASRLFRFCPKPVARMIGTLLYPHVG